MPVLHKKVNSLTAWVQADVDKQIAAGLIPAGTLITGIPTSHDWNDTHTISVAQNEMDTSTANALGGYDSGGNYSTVTVGSGLSLAGGELVATAGGGGTVTSTSVTSANGFAGTVATATTTPAITISTSVTGILLGNGTAVSAATAGTDYQAPITLTTTGTSGAATFSGGTLNIPQYAGASYTAGTGLTLTSGTFSVNVSQNISTLSNLTGNGLIKTSGGTGALSTATAGTDYSAGTSALSTGIVKSTTSTGALTIAVAGDFPTLNQNTTGSAATLTTARAINGVNFDGSAAITVTAAAGTLTGATLASGVTASSLTSFGSSIALGTPDSGNLTNCTGTASGLTAGQVTNATLTTALTVNTGTVTLTGNSANTSVLTIGAGAVAVSGSNTGDQTSVSGNAGTATALQTGRTINGTTFDGTTNITVAAAAGTLTGSTLASGVTGSSLTSVGAQAQALNMNSHQINSVTDPTSAQDAATKNYVDNAVASLDSKPDVAYASTAALPANAYNNGSSGVGATLTGTANGPLLIDGVTILLAQSGERVLVAAEAAPANNGWYTITQVGVAAVSPYILTRATESDQAAEIGAGYLTGVVAPNSVAPGTSNNGKVFISIANDPFTVGMTSVTFSQVGGTYSAGTGLTLTGNTFSVNASQTQITAVGTVSSGTWSGAFGSVTGANLTNLTAANISAGTAGISVTGNAGTVTGATLTTALTVNTGTLTLTASSANTSVLTVGAGAVSISGSNTGDQTITLTGGVTGSGTGSFATTIATPGTLTVSSTNSTATAHTHAIASSSAPGAAASVLATDSSGIIGSTGTRIVKGWFTDLTVTNSIAGSITGNAATVTTNANLTGAITSSGNATSLGSFTSAQLATALTDETGTGASVFAGSPTLTGTVTAAAITMTGSLYLNGGTAWEAVYANGNSGTTFAVNLDNGNLQRITITGAVAITQTTPTQPGKYTLIITQDATGHVYSLSGVKWVGGTAPAYSTAASKVDVFSIIYDGTNYYGMGGIAFS